MRRTRHYEQGIVAVLVAIGLVALLAMAGLAIDTGQLVLNKSRLQSTVDAAALAAAKTLDETGSETQATAAANQVFKVNADRLRGASGAARTIQYSSTLSPFVAGSSPANYVRVRADNLSWRAGFIRVLGFDTLATGASAVAGPSAPIGAPCDLFPVAVCADDPLNPPDWGFEPYIQGVQDGTLVVLKMASKGVKWDQGTGLFHLIRLGGMGDNVVRLNMAGGGACAEDMVSVDPQPGGGVGPVAQGMNTRFGDDKKLPASQYPPDLIVRPAPETPLASDDGVTVTFNGEQIDGIVDGMYSYADYAADYRAGTSTYTHAATGRASRRVVTVPIIDCSVPGHGTSQNLPVKGFGSFFLLQPVEQKGNEGYIFGEYLGEGPASGTPGPTGGYGVYKIVLHNDPDSPDS